MRLLLDHLGLAGYVAVQCRCFFVFLSYPLLSTGWDPVISGAIGSLYTAVVPSIVTETLTPIERGTGKNK